MTWFFGNLNYFNYQVRLPNFSQFHRRIVEECAKWLRVHFKWTRASVWATFGGSVFRKIDLDQFWRARAALPILDLGYKNIYISDLRSQPLGVQSENTRFSKNRVFFLIKNPVFFIENFGFRQKFHVFLMFAAGFWWNFGVLFGNFFSEKCKNWFNLKQFRFKRSNFLGILTILRRVAPGVSVR